MRSLLVRALGSPPCMWLGERYHAYCVPIFMLHRFSCPHLGIEGHELTLLKFALEYLRKQRFNFVSVEQVALAIRNRAPLAPRSIAFSIDDGFWDHVEGPAALFAAYDCPTTYFVTTGFVSKELWLWDSKVEYLLEESAASDRSRLNEPFPAADFARLSRAQAAEYIIFELTKLSSDAVEKKLKEMQRLLGVSLPAKAPDKFQSTSWARLRDVSRMGMCVAPHSYSHPILANESDEISLYEMERSREDVEDQVGSASNIFCYPVGRPQDFTQREERYAESLGFAGAVSASPPAVNIHDQTQLYSLPRFAFPDTKADIIQYATWIESFKERLRTPKAARAAQQYGD